VPEPNPFILPSGTAAGSFMAVISGKVVDSFGPIGKFAMIACMYTIFATCIQFVPETYGKSLENLNVSALPATCICRRREG
jgi:hypothetical protein